MGIGKILVGNDQLDFTRLVFPSISGLEIEFIDNPEELIQKAKTGEYTAVITDMNYTPGGKQGIKVLEELRELDVRKVVWSWDTYEQAVKERAAELGAEVIGKDDISKLVLGVIETASKPIPEKPRKQTRIQKYMEKHQVKISRGEFLKTLGWGALLIAGAGTIIKVLDSVPNKDADTNDADTIDSLILKNTKLGDEYSVTIEHAIKNADSEGYPAVSIEDKMKLVGYNQSFKGDALLEKLGKTIICAPNSKFLDNFYKQMPKDVVNMIKSNVRYIVFSPDVIIDRNGDVNGLSVGQGLIFVDTEADNGGKKNPLIFPGTIAHESRHEKDKSRDLGVLLSEKGAYETQAKVLRHQDKTIDDQIIDADLSNVEARLDTAVYLEQFGSDFKAVYPHDTILAKHLLDANVSVLAKYSSNQREGDSKHNEELYHAARFSKIVRDNSREEALRQLYEVVSHPEKSGTLEQVSAASAIQYLAPNACTVESSADVASGSGCQIHFGKRSSTSELGKGVEGSEGYGVSGMPALNDLVNDRDLGSLANMHILEYKLEGNSYRVVSEENRTTVYFAKAEGRPHPSFYRSGIAVIDRDKNGRFDIIRVHYANNDHKIDEDLVGNDIYLAKYDDYDAQGNYLGSGFIGVGKLLEQKDCEWNRSIALEIARKENLEKK